MTVGATGVMLPPEAYHRACGRASGRNVHSGDIHPTEAR